ncbi:MAG: hypothetical protein HY401_01435 [Elusimicrobia bacterium]|nr:hypothetical protein [Elusimicrobiota bacterium]
MRIVGIFLLTFNGSSVLADTIRPNDLPIFQTSARLTASFHKSSWILQPGTTLRTRWSVKPKTSDLAATTTSDADVKIVPDKPVSAGQRAFAEPFFGVMTGAFAGMIHPGWKLIAYWDRQKVTAYWKNRQSKGDLEWIALRVASQGLAAGAGGLVGAIAQGSLRDRAGVPASLVVSSLAGGVSGGLLVKIVTKSSFSTFVDYGKWGVLGGLVGGLATEFLRSYRVNVSKK